MIPHLTEDPVQITMHAIRVTQPIGDFYVGAMTAAQLCRICDFDIRRLDKDNLGDYLGLQREIDTKRIKDIVKFVHTADASFPTAVILAVDERCAAVVTEGMPANSRLCELTLKNVQPTAEVEEGADETVETVILFRQIARVLDGQHRVKALMDANPPVFDVNVAIFIGSDLATQAGIFSTVNLAQTKVNRSLVYDLFSYNKSRSPEKTCHEIAVVLDKEAASPFQQRIKRLGVATEGRFAETLSQATFVRALLPLMSDDPITDRDLGKRGRTVPRAPQSRRTKLIFRDFFVDERDAELASMIWDYFDAVKERWPVAWEFSGTGRVLNKTTGFNALMRFLRDVYLHYVQPGQLVTKEQFSQVFARVRLQDDEFTKEVFVPGSSGTSELHKTLLLQAGIERAK